MADDGFLKLPLQSSLNRAATARAEDAIQNTGRALPCQVTAVEGSIVTVQFEANIPYQQPDGTMAVYQLPPITLAKAESQWMRSPTQVGDFGLTLPADTFLGGISGIGTGVANTGVNYGNLSGTTLVWVPVAALSFGAAPDPNKAWVNGPAGVVISDAAQTIMLIVDKVTGTIQMAGSGTVANDGLVRKSDIQAFGAALVATLQAWGAAHFQGGTSTPPVPTAPTATASAKTFSS